MKVTITNKEADARLATLQSLTRITSNVPAIVGYRIVQNIQAMDSAIAPYRTMVDAAVKKYSNGGTSIKRDDNPEAFDACAQELEEIASLTVEIEIQTFPLEKIAKLELPLNLMFAMDIMIEKTT